MCTHRLGAHSGFSWWLCGLDATERPSSTQMRLIGGQSPSTQLVHWGPRGWGPHPPIPTDPPMASIILCQHSSYDWHCRSSVKGQGIAECTHTLKAGEATAESTSRKQCLASQLSTDKAPTRQVQGRPAQGPGHGYLRSQTQIKNLSEINAGGEWFPAGKSNFV